MVPLKLLFEKDLSDGAFKLAVLLIHLTNEKKGHAWPSWEWCAEFLTCSHSSIKRYAKELKDSGALEVVEHYKRNADKVINCSGLSASSDLSQSPDLTQVKFEPASSGGSPVTLKGVMDGPSRKLTSGPASSRLSNLDLDTTTLTASSKAAPFTEDPEAERKKAPKVSAPVQSLASPSLDSSVAPSPAPRATGPNDSARANELLALFHQLYEEKSFGVRYQAGNPKTQLRHIAMLVANVGEAVAETCIRAAFSPGCDWMDKYGKDRLDYLSDSDAVTKKILPVARALRDEQVKKGTRPEWRSDKAPAAPVLNDPLNDMPSVQVSVVVKAPAESEESLQARLDEECTQALAAFRARNAARKGIRPN